MADFLERVSRMALGAAPAIQPLVASRYAPGAQAAVPEMMERDVTLDSPAGGAVTSVAEARAAVRPEGDDPGALQPGLLVATTAEGGPAGRRGDLRGIAPIAGETLPPEVGERASPDMASRFVEPHAAAPRDDARAIAPAVVDARLLGRQPGVDAHGQQRPRRLHAGEDMPFPGESGNALRPPAALELVRPDSASRLVGDLTVIGQRPEAAADEHIRLPNPVHNGSRHRAIAVEPGATTGDSEEPAARADGLRALEPPLSPRFPAQIEAREAPISPRATSPGGRLPGPAPSTARHGGADARASRPAGSEPASARPAVRVTIGRVDVRALMPPAPPVGTPTAAGPKLSLDDYLRQQSRRPR